MWATHNKVSNLVNALLSKCLDIASKCWQKREVIYGLVVGDVTNGDGDCCLKSNCANESPLKSRVQGKERAYRLKKGLEPSQSDRKPEGGLDALQGGQAVPRAKVQVAIR